jgi:hypothetical protein
MATVKEDLKNAILAAYVAMGQANRYLSTLSPMFNATTNESVTAAKPKIRKCRGGPPSVSEVRKLEACDPLLQLL